MSIYEDKLDNICAVIEKVSGTAGERALKKIIMDLEGDGPIGELLHSLDENNFKSVIDLLIEFRVSGRREAFNSIHFKARERINKLEKY